METKELPLILANAICGILNLSMVNVGGSFDTFSLIIGVVCLCLAIVMLRDATR